MNQILKKIPEPWRKPKYVIIPLALLLSRYIFILTVWVAQWVGIVSVGTLLLLLALQWLSLRVLPAQNLRIKYDAQWALVTGASSGIGKAISEGLAAQGLSVVLVALDDKMLVETYRELTAAFPAVSFRRVGVDLSLPGEVFMPSIISATSDIDVSLIFNNAGYLQAGLFADTDYDRVHRNFMCNAASAIPITHHFVRNLIQKKRRGLVTFTSSSAGYIAGPCATLYSATKAFISNFGLTLASEIRHDGIDVVVMHPSPVKTNFYNPTNAQLDALQQAKKAAVTPDVIATHIFAAAGRVTMWDQGAVSIGLRFISKVIDGHFLSELIVRCAHLVPDQKKMVAQRSQELNKVS